MKYLCKCKNYWHDWFLLNSSTISFLIKMAKLTLCFILLFSLGLSAKTDAQVVTMQVKSVQIKTILSNIRKQTGVHFLYEETMLDKLGKVTISAKNEKLETFLNQLFQGHPLTFERTGNNISIISKPLSRPPKKSGIELRGTVRDSLGQPMEGVSIRSKSNNQIGTSTDANGRFILDLPEQTTIIVKFIGYISQEIFVSKSEELNVTMIPDPQGLEEVVVVGFGKQKKQSLVSSVSTVSGETLRAPTRSLSNNLAGQLPGLIAVQRSGMPGYDDAEFWIRGTSSFAGGTSPLVLVDGIPRSLSDIDPDEIETFSLLKDAAATAVYGAEGANGVILITSKRGKIQKTNIAYRGEYSYSQPTRVPQTVGSYDYLRLYNEALANDGRPPMFSDELLELYRTNADPDLYPSSNWYELLLLDHTYNTRHNINFRGGGERTRFFVSGGYFSEGGLFLSSPDYNNNSNLDRFNLRSNIDMNVTSSTTLRVDIAGQYAKVNRPHMESSIIFERLSRVPPYLFPMIYSDGTLSNHPSYNNNKTNPYNMLTQYGYRKEWRSTIQSRLDLEQKLDIVTPGLKVKGSVSFDAYSLFNSLRPRTPDSYYATGRDEDGKLIFDKKTNKTAFGEPEENNAGNKRIYLEAAINYDRTFANVHELSGLLLTYQKETQYHNEALAFRKQAYVGRVTYNYNQIYSIEANFGITGSEQFAKGHRFGIFPAVGIAYNVANETFFPESLKSTINSLKLRASIGRTGNDEAGGARFLYRSQFGNYGVYPIGIGTSGASNYLTGLTETRFDSPTIGWEIENKRNFGIDLSLFNNKLQITADYFNNERYNILLQRRTIVNVAGYQSNPWQNFGRVRNRGIDGSIVLNQPLSTDWNLSFRGNFTFARNKITEYDEIKQLYPWMELTGKRLNGINDVYIAERLFTDDDFYIYDDWGTIRYDLKEGIAPSELMPSPKPGDIKFKDLNGDGIANSFDKVKDAQMPTVPEIVFGFGTSIKYKGAFVSMFFQGVTNVSTNINNQSDAFMPFSWGLQESNVRKEILDSRWTAENPSQDVFFPRLQLSNISNNEAQSTWWVKDASFIRLKNVEFGYNFNFRKKNKPKIKELRVYAMGQNVAIWDHLKFYDPELGNSAGGTVYPLPSLWSGGVEFTF